MPDPLRRRLRAKLLSAATHAGAWIPGRLVQGGLAGAARIADGGRYGRRVRENLALAYGDELPDEDLEAIATEVLGHSAHQLATWLRLARGAPPEGPRSSRGAWIDELVTVDPSIAHLEDTLEGGRGAIVVTAHLGNWELLCAALRRRGLRGGVVGLHKHRDPSADWLVAMRRAYGVETLPQDVNPRRLVEILGAGGVIGMLTDLEVRRLDGEFVPFFGRPALTMTAPAALARAGRRPLLPVRCVREAAGGYRLSCDEPLTYDRELARSAATTDLLVRLNETYERWIRETPGQWAWHQPRWRTAPGTYEAIPLAGR